MASSMQIKFAGAVSVKIEPSQAQSEELAPLPEIRFVMKFTIYNRGGTQRNQLIFER